MVERNNDTEKDVTPRKFKIHDYTDPDILPFAEICRRVSSGENFAFARFGDGEFNAILKVDRPGFDPGPDNCDGHMYFPKMGKELRDSFLFHVNNPKPNYFIGIHMSRDNGESYLPGYNGRETVEWLCEHEITPMERKFAANAVFHDACGKKHGTEIGDFFKATVNRRVILVGPPHLRRQTAVRTAHFVECPKQNSYLASAETLNWLDLLIRAGDVVLFCAGMPTPIWIDELYEQHEDSVTLIDLGSALDPAAGVKSRSFHK